MNADQSNPSPVEPLADVEPKEMEGISSDALEPQGEKEIFQGPSDRQSSSAFKKLIEHIETISVVGEKIEAFLSFMKQSLSKHEHPKFRDFWDARRQCLPLFKQQIAQKVRADLWLQYIDLSTEARRLKELLDEQSIFAFEQIDLAITSIEKEIASYEALLTKEISLDALKGCNALERNKEQYILLQKNLQLLNQFATKITSLRKEVIRTEMRMKNKNKLFEKLSVLGESVFPKRKEMIRECSALFACDIDQFAKGSILCEDAELKDLFSLREEVKSLQNVAKELTLNPQTFNQTRQLLSECWDKLKVVDKERKKEFAQKKQQSRQVSSEALEKIKAFEEFCLQSPPIPEALEQFDSILRFLGTLGLSFQESKYLKDQLFKARSPVWERQRREQEEKERKEKEKQEEKRAAVSECKDALNALIRNCETVDLEEIVAKLQQIKQSSLQLSLSKVDKMEVDKLMRQISDRIDDKKEKKIISLSESDANRHSQLSSLLQERRQMRQEVKEQIESYRKILGGSGFDFEKAMMYRDLIESEKERLEKISLSIEEIEEKIAEIEG